jgi:plasmid maintenance system antidote protein VapI
MNPRSYWQAFAARFETVADLAEHLGVPYPTVYAVCKGQRGIGRALAERMVAADPTLDVNVLVWVRAGKAGDEPGTNAREAA